MISMKAITSSGGATKYFTEQHRNVEYYADEKVNSEWGGHGADMQGLGGRDVTPEELTKQLDGKVQEFNKEDGTWNEVQLGVQRKGELQHRAGWDLTFSAPKSISLESEVWGKADVRQAHEDAVKVAMTFLEDKAAQTRANGQFVKTGNLTYSMFQHATSRAGDPQTHTHVLVANVTFVDGKAYSLSNEKLMDFRATADAVYKNELAHQLISKGYALKWDSKGNFEISGYNQANLDAFSKRNDAIKDALAERGLSKATASHAARQIATLGTRQAKDHPETAEAHRAKWQEEAATNGVNQAVRDMANATAMGGQKVADLAVQGALNHLTEREMAFSEQDLWKAACKFSQGAVQIDRLAAAIQEQLKSGNLSLREDGKYTTRDSVQSEIDMAKHLAAGSGAHEAVMTEKEFEKALAKFERAKGFELSGEQRNAARMILVGDDRFQGVQGLAGTGKTTLLEFVREAAENKGWHVQGFANGGAQADKLQMESGIKSDTTARFLADFHVTSKDASLAMRALATHEKNSGMLGHSPNWKALERGVRSGDVKLEFDSQRRAYYTDPLGNTWTHGLSDKVNVVYSKNLNHLGLTETKYVITSKGVFKSGGDPVSEVAGALREKLGGSSYVADKVLGHFEKWQKCGFVEAAAIRAQAALETKMNRYTELKVLREMASQANGQQQRVLYVMDEASLSGQREFNRVLQATEKSGARSVFLGDVKQHQGVEAGKAFELAQKHMPMSFLGAASIRRQETEHAKGAVADILIGKHSDAVRGLDTTEISANQEAVRQKYSGMEKLSEKDRENFKNELKTAAEQDNQLVIRQLAKDYASMPQQDRDRTLVITSTNQDRNAINEAVRDELKKQGQLQDGQRINTLQKSDRTSEELKQASSFEKGQVVSFTSDNKSLGVEKGMEGRVEASDSRLNTVTLQMDDGRMVKFNPEKVQGKELFNEQRGKEFAIGDKVAFTKNDKELNVRNGQTGTVEKFDCRHMTVRMDNGEKREVDTHAYKHMDHAYVTTSHKAQGQTFDRAFKHHNTEAGRHGDRETYVDMTRVRQEAKVYTQNAEKAALQAGYKMDKEAASLKSVGKIENRAVDTQQENGKREGIDPARQRNAIAEKSEGKDSKEAGGRKGKGEGAEEKGGDRPRQRDYDFGR